MTYLQDFETKRKGGYNSQSKNLRDWLAKYSSRFFTFFNPFFIDGYNLEEQFFKISRIWLKKIFNHLIHTPNNYVKYDVK